MPQNRSYLSGGTPYPTGKSPLVLDIENNIMAVTQQMVENKKREIAEKKLRVTENEKMMLDALDAETVAGVGDQVALEFGNSLDKLKNDWAKKFYEKGGELNTEDKLALEKDKRNIQQKLKNQAAEITTMQQVQKDLAIQRANKDRRGLYDFEKTSKWLSEYTKSGKVGSGQFVNGLVFSQPEFGEEFVSKYDDLVKNAAKSTDETIRVLNPNTGLYESKTTNKPTMAQTKEYLMTRPEFQPLVEQDPVKANALVDDMIRGSFLTKTEQGFSGVINKRDGSGTTAAEEQANSDYFNNIAEGILRGDKDILNTLKGSIDKEIGTISSVGYEDGNIILYPTDTKKNKPVSIPLPNRASKDAVLRTKRNILSRFENLGGRIADQKTLNKIQADWGDNAEVEPDMPLTLKSVTSTLAVAPEEMEKKTKAANKKDLADGKENPTDIVDKAKYQQHVIDAIKKNVPDAKVEGKGGGTFESNKNFVKIYNDKGGFKEYDLRKETDRKDLNDWIIENSNYKQKFKEKHGYSTTERPKTETKKTDDPLGIL